MYIYKKNVACKEVDTKYKQIKFRYQDFQFLDVVLSKQNKKSLLVSTLCCPLSVFTPSDQISTFSCFQHITNQMTQISSLFNFSNVCKDSGRYIERISLLSVFRSNRTKIKRRGDVCAGKFQCAYGPGYGFKVCFGNTQRPNFLL